MNRGVAARVHDDLAGPLLGVDTHRSAGLLAPDLGTDVDTVLRTCFITVFSALVIRVAYGPGFAADPVDDETYASQLARMSSSYLLNGHPSPPA